MPLATRDTITGLILAGGRDSRVSGTDKGLLELHGLPLVEHVLARLAPQVGALIISANRNQERYRALVPRVVSDEAPSSGERDTGPLAGIQAGLAHTQTAWVVVVPCDAPQLPRSLVVRLADAVNTRGVRAACARTDGRLQPVFCLLATALGPSLTAHLSQGGRAVHGWLEEIRATAVDFEDPMGFRTFNTPEALSGGLA